MPTVGSLFSGIGGLDLGLKRAGWTVRWQVEIDPFCRAVLAKHWPDVPRLEDVRTLTGAELDRVDLIAGGFPCQPVSVAGKRLGADDARWLWPEFARVIRALRPRLVLVENVPGLLFRGGGMGDVLRDLAGLGYVSEWDCLSAKAVGAPHLRARVWIVAHAHAGELRLQPTGTWCGCPTVFGDDGAARSLADADRGGCEVVGLPESAGITGAHRRQPDGRRELRELDHGAADLADASGERLATWGGLLGGGSGAHPAVASSAHWAVEPDVDRVAHGVPARVDRLRGLGNAVVPQVAEWIGRRLIER